MQQTTNLGLKKPEYTDFVDIQDINGNMDEIDKQISNLSGVMGVLSTLNTSVKTSIVAAINSLLTLASTTVNGLMSKTDKAKLDGIAVNANNYVHPGNGTNPHGTSKADVGLGSVQNYGIATIAEVDAVTRDDVYVTPAGLLNLKTSVVNGKQEVVNAINGKIGYLSGLTTNNPHADYAWWITNKIKSVGGLALVGGTPLFGALPGYLLGTIASCNGVYYSNSYTTDAMFIVLSLTVPSGTKSITVQSTAGSSKIKSCGGTTPTAWNDGSVARSYSIASNDLNKLVCIFNPDCENISISCYSSTSLSMYKVF